MYLKTNIALKHHTSAKSINLAAVEVICPRNPVAFVVVRCVFIQNEILIANTVSHFDFSGNVKVYNLFVF